MLQACLGKPSTLAMFLVVYALSGCVSPTPVASSLGGTEATTSPYACRGGTTQSANAASWLTFDCSCLTEVAHGMTSNNLTIGESTMADVQLRPGITQACFVSGKLSTLYMKDDKSLLTMKLEQQVEKYGRPNRVTWGPNYAVRAVIWSEKGLLVTVNIGSHILDGEILVFSPIPASALETSWLMASLPNHLIGAPPEDVVYPTEEDPWGIQQ
jgi:hypothetical protein